MSGAASHEDGALPLRAIRVHKLGSVLYRLGLDKDLEITERMSASPGNAVVVRALSEKRVYSELELESGRMSKIFRGDILAGALGRRRALRGFVGEVPRSIRAGDTLSLLNLGGVIGSGAAAHNDLGAPVAVEVLGMPVRDGRIVNVADASLPEVATLRGIALPPVVVVSATSMHSGKTRVTSDLVQEFSKGGLSIAGGKLTGVACRRDLLSLEDHGASATASFVDVGYASTAGLTADRLVVIARSILAYLASGRPDIILLELGDGILGDYGVLDILRDEEFASAVRMHIFCAVDPVGAWGGQRFLRERAIEIDLFSGPATDNDVGVGFIERELGKPATNAIQNPKALAERVREHLGLESDGRRVE